MGEGKHKKTVSNFFNPWVPGFFEQISILYR